MREAHPKEASRDVIARLKRLDLMDVGPRDNFSEPSAVRASCVCVARRAMLLSLEVYPSWADHTGWVARRGDAIRDAC